MSPHDREAVVTGKGDKQRTSDTPTTRPAHSTGTQRERAKHPMARVTALWLGVRGGPMTASGVYQIIERRASRDAASGQPAQVPAHLQPQLPRPGRCRGRLDGTERLEKPADARPVRAQRTQRARPPSLRRRHGSVTR